MRDILKRIFIGVAIGMALFFLKTEVFALSWDLAPKGETFIFNNAKNVIINISSSVTGSYGQVVSRTNFDNSFTNSAGYHFAIIPYTSYSNARNLTGTSPLIVGDPVFSIKLISNGEWSTCNYQTNYIVCPIKPNLTYSAIQLYLKQLNYDVALYDITFNNSALFMNSLSQSNIENQTQQILDSDSAASATYNNDYSTTSYDTAESNMNQNLDKDVSSFIFNPAQWINAFNWIWQTLTSFVQINAKVFATITSFLTLSFVGLVIGRS